MMEGDLGKKKLNGSSQHKSSLRSLVCIIVILLLVGSSLTNDYSIFKEVSQPAYKQPNNATKLVSNTEHESQDMNPSDTSEILDSPEDISSDSIQQNSTVLRSNDPSNFRLEFLHIPKNAGTTIEHIGLLNNITWGGCHFEFPWKRDKKNVLKHCPPLRANETLPQSRICYWHYSLSQLSAKHFSLDPYDNALLLTREQKRKPKRFFAVIRNPFQRYISWYFFFSREKKSAKALNLFIQNVLDHFPYSNFDLGSNMFPVCQYQYILSEETNGGMTTINNMVHHVLQFENLTQEFNELMALYQMPPHLTQRAKYNAQSAKAYKKMTTRSLTKETIAKIVSVCDKDFQLGRGYSRQPF
jgi:hypothetical protein